MEEENSKTVVVGGGRRSPDDEVPAGAHVGEYVVGELLGRGGCGSIYRATHRSLRLDAAIKVLHAALATSPKMVERFVREVSVVNLLRHPHIVSIYELGTLDDGRPFYAMELLRGRTAEALVREEGRLSPEEALAILEPVCSALAAAHDAGIVHRDIKASNIFLDEDAGSRTVKLLDFGIAKLVNPDIPSSGLTSVGRQIGTLTAMAPEQILGGQADARADIYALGVLLFKFLTGQNPFHARNDAELAWKHVDEPPPRPSQRAAVPATLDAIVLRCLEKQPERRFDAVRSFIAALREALGMPHGEADPSPGTPVLAVGLCVALGVDTPGDEVDEKLASALGHALDAAEAKLRSEGFGVALATGSVVFGVRALPTGAEERLEAREEALDLAVRLREEVRAQFEGASGSGAGGWVRAAVYLHVASAMARAPGTPAAGLEIVGGALARLSTWTLPTPPEGTGALCATKEALEGLTRLFKVSVGPGALFSVEGRRAPARSPV